MAIDTWKKVFRPPTYSAVESLSISLIRASPPMSPHRPVHGTGTRDRRDKPMPRTLHAATKAV